SEVESYKVFSSQRLFDLRNQLGHSNSRTIEPSVALEVARMAGAATLLTGNIIQTGSKTILTSRLIEVDRGTVIKSQRVEGTDVYAMVDELTDQVRNDLNLTGAEVRDISIPVIEKTSGSMTAYQHYLEGMDLFNEQKFKEAIVHFEDALEIDSGFTSVYYNLAMAQWWAQSIYREVTSEQALVSLNKILNGENYRTTKEKLLAEGARELFGQKFDRAVELYSQIVNFLPDEKDAWYGLGEALFHGPADMDRAQMAFEKVLELDPNYKVAYRHIFDIYANKELYSDGKMQAIQFINLFPDSPWGPYYLGMMNDFSGDYAKAAELYVDAIKTDPEFKQSYTSLVHLCRNHLDHGVGIQYASELVQIFPNKPAPYDMQGNMYLCLNDYSEALKSFENGFLIAPNDYSFLADIGYTYQLMGLYDLAEQKYNLLLSEDIPDSWQDLGYQFLTLLYGERGMFNQVRAILEERVERERAKGPNQEAAAVLSLAFNEFLGSYYDQAQRHLDRALTLGPSTDLMITIYLIKGLVYTFQDQGEKLSQVTDLVASFITAGNSKSNRVHELTIHAMQFNRYYLSGAYDSALVEFTELQSLPEIRDYFYFQKGQIHLNTGDYENALAVADIMQSPLLTRDSRIVNYPRSFYLRGMVYEAQGNLAQARQNYQKLLNIWDKADEQIEIRRDAIERLARINHKIG
ncbi:MAG: tetratricopeptide repeat protein, partial [Candidatus Neomarinimicrobiota bacterium]